MDSGGGKKPGFMVAVVDRLKGKKSDDGDGADSEAKDDSAEDDETTAAGEELAAAIKGGDGAEIYSAFEALNRLCQVRDK